jgi:putative membrane-bound dehydrogenase-like protein
MPAPSRNLRFPLAALAALALAVPGAAQEIPHNQDRPPGPALSPEEARARMKVPQGFRVELFASEPEIANPVAMAFDARGRIWITESFEYPRLEAGPGRDCIKILEDSSGDGKADKITVFAGGLNIPCGLALGHGGVYVANSPDLILLEDTDGDDRADRSTVLLTGFGRHDTHELPNTLTWGPDGWLYGLNGVFNPAHIRHQGKEHRFTCALWRLHPRTLAFEVFAEGTSNPWGLAFDAEGSAFVEACVIDHLYHLTETGYYHRQAGSYPPFTWKVESIVRHKHQKAAYCGLAIYDAELYPAQYRRNIFMGNIHGNCINRDRLERDGSTYLAEAEADFLSTDDVWFMPVSIQLGPDGCFHVLDWYDRYHCYQDARRDPMGIDREKGRLWRIAYGEAPRPAPFDLAAESSAELVARLRSPNRWWRDQAQQLLAWRRDEASYPALRALALAPETAAPRATRLQALWTLVSCDDPGSPPRALEHQTHLALLSHADAGFRAWGVRAAGNARRVNPAVRERVLELAADDSPDVRLQVAIAASKLAEGAEMAVLLDVLSRSGGDPLIPRIVWRNLEPLIETRAPELTEWLESHREAGLAVLGAISGRLVERFLARAEKDLKPLAAILDLLLEDRSAQAAPIAKSLDALAEALADGTLDAAGAIALERRLSAAIGPLIAAGRREPLYLPAIALAAAWGEPRALAACRGLLLDSNEALESRLRALRALAAARDAGLLEAAARLLQAADEPAPLLQELLSGLGKHNAPEVAEVVIGALGSIPSSLRPQAIDVLAQRAAWAGALLDALGAQKLAAGEVNLNQVRRILAHGDEELARRVRETWGTVRLERNPDREQVIARMREVLGAAPGDPWAGKAVYAKTCAQCHQLFGEGHEVGPDITVNGRETLEALLSNLLDPNLVIGKDYQAHTVLTHSGRALSGLLIEDSPQRVVLKVAGGKEEVVPRADLLSLSASAVSLMPEDLEKTVTEEEFRDLIAYLRFEEAPPEPVELIVRGEVPPGERRITAEQRYGELTVRARFPGSDDLVELFRFRHSNDQRPFIHPLRAPGGGPVLTALRPSDHPWQYGVFTGHARANDIDFWHEKGWIRSRGLLSAAAHPDRVEITARSDWLASRRGGERLLVEEQLITVHAPERAGRYLVDVEWRLTPDIEVTLEEYDYGGLAFRPAAHTDRRHARPSEAPRRPWQGMSGRFGEGKERALAGVAILDHPENPNHPSAWRIDGQALINPAITATGAMILPAGRTAVFRYRLVVHSGHGDREALDEEYRRWCAQKKGNADFAD